MSIRRLRKVSSNDQPRLLYMRGYDWWVTNQYWERPLYTEKAKQNGRDFLARLLEEKLRKESGIQQLGNPKHKSAIAA